MGWQDSPLEVGRTALTARCRQCRAPLVKTSAEFYVCPNSHGKLVPAAKVETAKETRATKRKRHVKR